MSKENSTYECLYFREKCLTEKNQPTYIVSTCVSEMTITTVMHKHNILKDINSSKHF